MDLDNTFFQWPDERRCRGNARGLRQLSPTSGRKNAGDNFIRSQCRTSLAENALCLPTPTNRGLCLRSKTIVGASVCALWQCNGVSRSYFQFGRHTGARFGQSRSESPQLSFARREAGLAKRLCRLCDARDQYISRLCFRLVRGDTPRNLFLGGSESRYHETNMLCACGIRLGYY